LKAPEKALREKFRKYTRLIWYLPDPTGAIQKKRISVYDG
jgi:hypothetical protein